MILVVDCGTSFLKAALAEEQSCLISSPVRIRLLRPESPECWIQALEQSFRMLNADRMAISYIMITGQGPAAVAVTKDLKAPVSVLWESEGQNASVPAQRNL